MNEREKFHRMRWRTGRGWLANSLTAVTAEHAEHAEGSNAGTGKEKTEVQDQPQPRATGETHET
jgi:hypothetical protein